jgi:hypothetical protein
LRQEVLPTRQVFYLVLPGDVTSPSVIGLGGWQNFNHLFSGGDGIIYAVDQNGRLLFTATLTRMEPATLLTPRLSVRADG